MLAYTGFLTQKLRSGRLCFDRHNGAAVCPAIANRLSRDFSVLKALPIMSFIFQLVYFFNVFDRRW